MKNFAILIVLACVTVSACQTDAKRDVGGRITDLSEEKAIELSESDLNIPIIIPYRITEVNRVIKNNTITIDHIEFDGRKGYIKTERSPGIFSTYSTMRLKSRESFIETLPKWISNYTSPVKTKPHISRSSWGYYIYGEHKKRNVKCLLIRAGYQLVPSSYDNYDTVLLFRHCNDGTSIDQFSDLITKLAVIDNRDAFRAAVAAINKPR